MINPIYIVNVSDCTASKEQFYSSSSNSTLVLNGGASIFLILPPGHC